MEFRNPFKKKKRFVSRPSGMGSEPSFYSQHPGEAPLSEEELSANRGDRTRRTSRHNLGRREGSDNRSHRAVLLLLLRTGLIIFLIAGTLFVLKKAANYLSEPSVEQKADWEAKRTVNTVVSLDAADAAETRVDAALLCERIESWTLADRQMRAAQDLIRHRNHDEAFRRLQRILQAAPRHNEAQRLLADLLLQRGEYEQTKPLLVSLLDKNPEDSEAAAQLLNAFVQTGDHASTLALADWLPEKMLTADVMASVALSYMALEKYEQAQGLFKRILALDGKNITALEGLGRLRRMAEDYEGAVPYYQELIQLDSRPEYYRAVAICYAQLEEAGKAIVFMGQAFSLYGSAQVGGWLRQPEFDVVRETVEFRSLADRVVGTEQRKAIEQLRKRETEKAAAVLTPAEKAGGPAIELKPTQPLTR